MTFHFPTKSIRFSVFLTQVHAALFSATPTLSGRYGALQGLDKKQVRLLPWACCAAALTHCQSQTVEKHGADMVQIWRRSYDTPPPPLDQSNQYWPGHDRR
jgi:hypothetical protein